MLTRRGTIFAAGGTLCRPKRQGVALRGIARPGYRQTVPPNPQDSLSRTTRRPLLRSGYLDSIHGRAATFVVCFTVVVL